MAYGLREELRGKGVILRRHIEAWFGVFPLLLFFPDTEIGVTSLREINANINHDSVLEWELETIHVTR